MDFFHLNSGGRTIVNYQGTGGGGFYGGYGGGTFWNLFYIFRDILSQVVIVIISLAVVFFLYGILKYVTAGGDTDKIKEGRNYMIYGIIGLFVMVSFWGIVNILINTFELDTTPYVNVPYFQPSTNGGGGSGSGGTTDNLPGNDSNNKDNLPGSD